MVIQIRSIEKGDYGQSLKPGERRPGPYAASAIPSRGRQHAENECPTRSPFQRDRDRILHSTAFRRLTYKTQVFVFHEGDHFRTRLTHSLEVAQIARTIARQLRLDEDLAEALALAHDLGHSPFGHAGERALDTAMRAHGGFDHNAQSLRIVAALERKYLGFDGLNLTWETLEGLAKHNGPVADDDAVTKVARAIESWRSLDLASFASAEAQVAAIADDIAYLSHDVDDGLRAGLLSLAVLSEAPFVAAEARRVRDAKGYDDARTSFSITRSMITRMIADVVAEARIWLEAIKPASPDDIRQAGGPMVGFSGWIRGEIETLREFLFAHVYHHERVIRVMQNAETILSDLFRHYFAHDDALPAGWRKVAQGLDEKRRARLVADFVSGQTDRYAIAEHRRLFAETPELR